MVYVVNCRDCEFVRIGDTTFDTGNADLVKDQHEMATFDLETKEHHSVAWAPFLDEKAEEKLRDEYGL